MTALRRGISALALALVAPFTARAADVPVIRVFPPDCEAAPVSADDFVDALRVELAGRQPHCCVVGPSDNPAADAVKVTLAVEPCDPSTQDVAVTVDVGDPMRAITRLVSLADLPPEAHARALALAVAELLRSAGEPVVAPPPPVVAPPPPANNLYPVGTVAGALIDHFDRGTALWGGRLGVALPTRRWQVALEAGVAVSHNDYTAGRVGITLVSATLSAGPRFALGPVTLDAGPAIGFGRAWIKGQSDNPDVVPGSGSGFVSTLGVRAGIEVPATSSIRACAIVEGGGTIRRLDANVGGQPGAGIAGPYLMLAVGVRFGPAATQ
jgi:hypothetical protein